MNEERQFSVRLLDAFDSLRSDTSGLTTLGVARIQHERKAKLLTPPDLGRHNNTSLSFRPSYSSRRSRVDYKAEVGDLDLNSLAMAVVNYTATRIPEPRPCVVTTNKEGREERDFNHPCASLIRRPNRHHIWASYALAASMSWWFNGNVYFYENRSMTAVEELWYLPHFLTKPRWPDDGGAPNVRQWAKDYGEKEGELDPVLSHYQYDPPGKPPVLYKAKDIIHLKRGVDIRNPRIGVGAFECLYKELYGDDRMSLYTAAIMANMGIQVPVFSPKDDNAEVDETTAAHMKALWMQKTTGDRAGEPVIMPVPVDIEKFGFNPDELDLSALRLIPESRVCAVTGIPASTLQFLVGLQNGTSYASSEQAREQGFEEVILPLLRVWGEWFTWQLLSEFENVENARFEFDTSNVRVLQDDVDAKVRREVEVFRAGGSTYDEFLVAIGKPAVGPPLGDVRLIPGLSNPTSPERLLARATSKPSPEPTLPTDPATLAKFADIDRYLASLDNEMKEFMKTQQA